MSKQIDVFYDKEGKEINITYYHGRIEGKIINSVVDKNKASDLANWKIDISNKIKEAGIIGNTDKFYGLKLKLYFSPQKHKFDLDNYLKPIIDGIATGMFDDLNNSKKKHNFNSDDHLFYFISAIKIILPNNNQQEGIEYWIYKFENLRELYYFYADFFS